MASNRGGGRRRKARRKLVRAALAHCGFSVQEFARRIEVSHSHLNYVLRGERTSAWVDRCVDDLIRVELGVVVSSDGTVRRG